ncbi:MAG TPA: hypothetical protein VE487_00190 [Ilumatobacter sp.]|jgi:uncharacterized membrane protein YkoI|nr:hypothetical protein [Ilumatobacter sp.]
MKRRTIIISVAGAALVAAAAIGTAAAAGTMDDDESQQPITGDALAKASAAALAYTGGGKVTETEVGDEESYYEVEVTLDNGKQTDVQLDENFNVVTGMPDSESDAGDD